MALRGKKHRTRFRTWFLVILLAVFCIGGAELMVCRVMDPALYENITAPARKTVSLAEVRLQEIKHRIEEAEEQWRSEREEQKAAKLLEDQFAAEPELQPDGTPMADRGLAKFEQAGGQELLTGGNLPIVYYNQKDELWRDKPYGNDSIGGYGCGPTVMSMAVSSLSGQATTPESMAKWAREHGHWAKGQGSYLSIVKGAADAFGLTAKPMQQASAESLKQELASGKLVVALMTKGHFTKGGHFILLRGATLEGGILVADPSSRERSQMVWDAQLIISELSPSRTNGAPLWSIGPKLWKTLAE